MNFYLCAVASFLGFASFASACFQQNPVFFQRNVIQLASASKTGVRALEKHLRNFLFGETPTKRRKFTPEEDRKIIGLYERIGNYHWPEIAKQIPGKTARQCRERYQHYLDPQVKRGNWTYEEDLMIAKLYQEMGPKWAEMCKFLPGRTNNNIKNRYNNRVKYNMSTQMVQKVFPQNSINQLLLPIQPIQNVLVRSEPESLPESSTIEDVQQIFPLDEDNTNHGADDDRRDDEIENDIFSLDFFSLF